MNILKKQVFELVLVVALLDFVWARDYEVFGFAQVRKHVVNEVPGCDNKSQVVLIIQFDSYFCPLVERVAHDCYQHVEQVDHDYEWCYPVEDGKDPELRGWPSLEASRVRISEQHVINVVDWA